MTMSIKLWVDDERPVPSEEWIPARDYFSAVSYIQYEVIDEISLDHDLACFRDGKEYTGYDVLMFILERKNQGYGVPAKINIHTANVVARERMLGVLERYF